MECQSSEFISLLSREKKYKTMTGAHTKKGRLPESATNSLSNRRKPKQAFCWQWLCNWNMRGLGSALQERGLGENWHADTFTQRHTFTRCLQHAAICFFFLSSFISFFFFSTTCDECHTHYCWSKFRNWQISGQWGAASLRSYFWQQYESLASDVRLKVGATCLMLSMLSCQGLKDSSSFECSPTWLIVFIIHYSLF